MFLSLLALVSTSTIAGVSTISLGNGSPNISSSTVKPNSIIKDGYEYDWDNLATNDVKNYNGVRPWYRVQNRHRLQRNLLGE